MNKKKKLDQNTIQTAKRLLKYMTGTHKIQFIIVFICIFISSAASIAVSLSLKFLLDDFIIPLIGQTDPNFHPSAGISGRCDRFRGRTNEWSACGKSFQPRR